MARGSNGSIDQEKELYYHRMRGEIERRHELHRRQQRDLERERERQCNQAARNAQMQNAMMRGTVASGIGGGLAGLGGLQGANQSLTAERMRAQHEAALRSNQYDIRIHGDHDRWNPLTQKPALRPDPDCGFGNMKMGEMRISAGSPTAAPIELTKKENIKIWAGESVRMYLQRTTDTWLASTGQKPKAKHDPKKERWIDFQHRMGVPDHLLHRSAIASANPYQSKGIYLAMDPAMPDDSTTAGEFLFGCFIFAFLVGGIGWIINSAFNII